MAAVARARGDAASLVADALSKVRVSGMRMEFETYSTGGKDVSTPPNTAPQEGYPTYRGFDQGQSFYVDIEAKPSDAVIGRLSVNMLGRVPDTPIDEIFYENRGRTLTVQDEDGEAVDLWSNERVKVYQGSPELGRAMVQPGGLLPRRASALAVRGRLLRPLPRRLLR